MPGTTDLLQWIRFGSWFSKCSLHGSFFNPQNGMHSSRRVANRFYARLITAMSWGDALKTLDFNVGDNPSDTEVNKAYRKKYIENKQLHPDSGGDPDMAVKLNVAKDTLQGKLRPDRGTGPTRRRPGGDPPGGWQPEDNVRKQRKERPPPPERPPGDTFDGAMSRAGGVDWKISSGQGYTQTSSDGYVVYTHSWLLIGEASGHFVIARLTKTEHSNTGGTSDPSWDMISVPVPKSVNFMKAAPKTIKELMTTAGYWKPKFEVLSSRPTEDFLGKLHRGTLTFKNAILGSGMISEDQNKALKGQKIQVEVEPVKNKAKMDAIKDSRGRVMGGDVWKGYDYVLYFNGKPYKLTDSEMVKKEMELFAWGVFGTSFKEFERKKNLNRMRGTGYAGISGRESIEYLRDKIVSNPAIKEQLQEALNRMAKKKASIENLVRRYTAARTV